MTTYAYDTSTNHHVAVWENGIGATARTVARLHARTRVTVAMNLGEALLRRLLPHGNRLAGIAVDAS